MSFKWDRFFETGIAVVDAQHRGLVDIINEAEPLLTAESTFEHARLDLMFERLFDYAAIHFADEEALMHAHGLLAAYCDKHRQDHADFVGQLIEMRTQMGSATERQNGVALFRFLTAWLTFHILDEDQRMARQIAAVAAGKSARQAFDESSEVGRDDNARKALVAAVLDLYTVVGERNRSLKRSNQQLLEMSRQLESRVSERTAELRQTMEKMEHTQSQLLQSEKMAAIGQLAAGVAHEINNPVGFVNSNLGALRKYVTQLLSVIDTCEEVRTGLPENDPRRQKFEQACEAADLGYLKQDVVDLLDESSQGLNRVRKIVQDLKDFSHVDESDWQEADINAGLESTLNVVANELKYKATVVKRYGDLPPVRCVAAQINQVFMNLLVNAAQAIDQQGTIKIGTGCADQRVWIEIADTGKGMSEDVRQRIFEPFYTTKPVGVGTGLGLSISWDIVVKKHGGQLSVSSEPGRGTCFRIELPVATHRSPGEQS